MKAKYICTDAESPQNLDLSASFCVFLLMVATEEQRLLDVFFVNHNIYLAKHRTEIIVSELRY